MGGLEFTIKYRVNTGIVLSPRELFSLYLYGINVSSNDGMDFSDENLRFYIEAAQREIENYFNLRIKKQLISGNTSYYRDDYWQQFPIIRTDFPVRDALSLVGMLNKVEQIIFPQSWLRCNTNTQGMNKRIISVVPTGSSTTEVDTNVILTGITTQIGYQTFKNIPWYWDMQYITGFDIDQIPMDLVNVIGMLGSLGFLGIAGDLILGAGIATQSLSVDGLTQSIGSTASATNAGYGARILQYKNQIKDSVKRLKLIYDDVKFVVL